MTNRIRVEAETDALYLENDRIHAVVGARDHVFDLSSVQKMVLLTTGLGPVCDDLGLAVDVGNDTVIFIMSEHRCFRPFLFDQMAKVLNADYQKIVEASVCIEDAAFVIYKKDPAGP